VATLFRPHTGMPLQLSHDSQLWLFGGRCRL
jgi:hypothetical protein